MLTDGMKAEAVVSALQEASPQLLAELAKSGKLLEVIKDRVNRFNLQLARQMQGKDWGVDDAYEEETLMPLLIDFPASENQKPLSRAQEKTVERVLEHYEESLPSLPAPV
jgi:hypothetical protein